MCGPYVKSAELRFVGLVGRGCKVAFRDLRIVGRVVGRGGSRVVTESKFPRVPKMKRVLYYLGSTKCHLTITSSSPGPMVARGLRALSLVGCFSIIADKSRIGGPGPTPSAFLFTTGRLNMPMSRYVIVRSSAGNKGTTGTTGVPYV